MCFRSPPLIQSLACDCSHSRKKGETRESSAPVHVTNRTSLGPDRILRTTGPRPRSPLRRTIYRSEELTFSSELVVTRSSLVPILVKSDPILHYIRYSIPALTSSSLGCTKSMHARGGYYAHRALASPPELRYRFAQLLRLPRILNHHVAAKAS
ncbi:hypothetical protein QL285_097544 [Trifolium repens]|nr:hypothetical protein QL285_098849 [Trifolium repens]KAK2351150.1 hypothetical protein QL285_097544 [Trifolium repens]